MSIFTARYNKEDLSSLLQKRGIPALPVNTPSDFFKDSQIRDRRFFQPVTHPVIGTYEQPGVPFLVDGVRANPMPAPLLGQHNAEVYCGELGLTRNELDILMSEGMM